MVQSIISVFDILKIGVGPSSSHTLGPWRAAQRFVDSLKGKCTTLAEVISVDVILYGSLSKTGIGHGTDKAVVLGLSGYDPVEMDLNDLEGVIENVSTTAQLLLGGIHPVWFVMKEPSASATPRGSTR